MNATLKEVEDNRRIASAGRLPPIRDPQSPISNHCRSSSGPGAVAVPPAGRPRGPDEGSSTVGPAREATVLPDDDVIRRTALRRMAEVKGLLRLIRAAVRTYGARIPAEWVNRFVRESTAEITAIRDLSDQSVTTAYPPVVLGGWIAGCQWLKANS